MSPTLVLSVIVGYFLILVVVSYFTSRKADNNSFFIANRKSPWYLVAFAMIGTSLSGVTFISVPGWVGASQFGYLQTVLGYFVGYMVIAYVLMPTFYKLNLISIYTYLEQRFGKYSYKTGSVYFLISRIVGASFRLFLMASVLQFVLFDQWGVPFYVTVIITVALIWLYTYRGGLKTIVFTDTIQTVAMLLAVILSIWVIADKMDIHSVSNLFHTIKNSHYSQVFFFKNVNNDMYFWKSFLGGMFIAICMTGLDQEMMQKNLSCKNIKDAQKNMVWFSTILIFVNIIFLSLGVLLYLYAKQKGITLPKKSDDLYPLIATGGYLPISAGIFFILGLIAAAYSSADSALTALTTSFTIDILGKKENTKKDKRTRMNVHIGMSVVLILTVIVFNYYSKQAIIKELFKVAGFTYGPLLGLYAFGFLTKFKVKDKFIPYVCILSPVICYFLDKYSAVLFNGYKFGFEILIVNGLITFIGLCFFIEKRTSLG